MKKWNLLLAALLLLLLPASGAAQELPDFLFSLCESVGEGLEQGAMQALAAMDRELTLEMTPSSERIEEVQPVHLMIKAGNPRPKAESVQITLESEGKTALKRTIYAMHKMPGRFAKKYSGSALKKNVCFLPEE